MITVRRLLVFAIAWLALNCAGPATAADVHGHALVLAGGGATGTAWETGVLLGLQEAGVDPNHADIVIGTSAGSIVGAQMRSGEPLATMLAAQKSVSPSGLAAWAQGVDPAYLRDTSEIYATQPITQAQRAEVGSRALAAKLPDEATWLATFYPIAGIASLTAWPAAPLDVVAVDAKTGAVAVFDASKADVAPLRLAVAASSAVPAFTPPITIGGHRYTDGGVAGTNIRLAQSNAVIVAIVPHQSSLVQADVDALRAAGSQVFTISPDDAAAAAMGTNALDASRKPAAADAGRAQGRAAAAELRFVW